MENLKSLRTEKGYTQAQLAVFAGVGPSVVARWENGETYPSLPQIAKLCSVLGCSPSQLFGEDKNGCIPVFCRKNRCEMHCPADICADFGIELEENLDDKYLAGDICFFSLDIHICGQKIVFADDGANGYVAFAENVPHCHRIIAVCTAVQQII